MSTISSVESQSMSDQRRKNILNILKSTYPHAHIALTNWKNPWELLVAVMLSAQCTDILVNKVTAQLFQKYKTLEDYCKVDLTTFSLDIKSTGFYNNKAKNILAAAKCIKEKFNGIVPQSMETLVTLPGVARKTANVVLGNAFHVVSGIAVDTHVHRLSQRLRLVPIVKIGGKRQVFFRVKNKTILDYKKDADPNKIEQQLMKILPQREWFGLAYRLIDHGRAVCKAQRPNCMHCVLQVLCPARRAT